MRHTRTREQLLTDYARKPVQRLIQVDLFADVVPGDPIVVPDADGDTTFSSVTDELRDSGSDLAVRIHIHPEANRESVLRVLAKFAKEREKVLPQAYTRYEKSLDE